MTEPLQLLQRYGDLVLFVWVLVDQMGVPIPAVPMLIAAGALAGIGSANLTVAIGLAAGASLIADVFWYSLGRRRGHRTLAWLCALSLEPDSCVRRTEKVFLARGAGALLFAKFLPGLNAVAAALAGIFGFGTSRFLLYAGAGGLTWAGSWAGLGYLSSDVLERIAPEEVTHLGATALAVSGAALGAYVLIKYARRRRFLRLLRIARITADELKQKLDAGEEVVILDLRTALDVEAVPYAIPGALRVAAEDIERRQSELPRDREIVLYCT